MLQYELSLKSTQMAESSWEFLDIYWPMMNTAQWIPWNNLIRCMCWTEVGTRSNDLLEAWILVPLLPWFTTLVYSLVSSHVAETLWRRSTWLCWVFQVLARVSPRQKLSQVRARMSWWLTLIVHHLNNLKSDNLSDIIHQLIVSTKSCLAVVVTKPWALYHWLNYKSA